jgi:hypothetical protein
METNVVHSELFKIILKLEMKSCNQNYQNICYLRFIYKALQNNVDNLLSAFIVCFIYY